MKFNAHNYQQYAIDFIVQNKESALFLDLGMGKTVTTLMAINKLMFEQFDVSKVLVICPLRVTRTWRDEIEKWNELYGIRYSVITGNVKQRMSALNKNADIYIINRENIVWLVEQSGVEFDFDFVVIDELSSFKNHQTARHKALMKVRSKIARICGLTGTPASNSLMDLFAEFKLLDGGERLGKFIGQYRSNYFRPDKMNGPIVYSYKLLPGVEEHIYNKISDVTISMKACDYLNMPELISNEYPVYLDDKEMQNYKHLKERFIFLTKEHEVTASNAASLSNKLSQMANGAIYTDGEEREIVDIHDQKLSALEDIIESANGKPVLVAYWFKHDYTRITARLQKLGIGFMKIDTDKSITLWCQGKLQVGLIHPASAGHGLNLQSGGSTLVWFGLTWSLELYQQTNARLWRQGQKASTVVIEHIVAKGTIDERILRALNKKELTQNALIDAVKADIGGV